MYFNLIRPRIKKPRSFYFKVNIMVSLTLTFLSVHFVFLASVKGLENGVARKPPMGWMSWQRFRCIIDCKLYPNDCISENLFRNMADLMVSEGYLDAGYEYLVIDDCWLATERDAQGRLQPDPKRFPSGIKNLSDYIHSNGLKFGIYEDYGTKTCEGYPGILGHLETDAKTFAEWEVDYVKIDGCNAPSFSQMEVGYSDFGSYLNKTGRPIVYSCSWPAYSEMNNVPANYPLLAKICNLWRNWGDISDSWNSVTQILKWFSTNQNRIAPFAGPGHWNDPDMLLVGNYGLSYEQSKAQMAIWAILAAPLLMSVDFREVKKEYKKILLHKDIIAINQDEMGIQGLRIATISNVDVWIKPITPVVKNSPSYAVAFLSHRSDGYPYAIKIMFSKLGLKNSDGYFVNDVYEPKEQPDVIQINDDFIVRVKPSGVVLLKATPIIS